MRLGRARVAITPPLPCALAGGVLPMAKQVADPLAAELVLLDDGERRILLVCCDCLGFDNRTAAMLRAELATAADCAPGAVLLAASHTHNGPASMSLGVWGEANDSWLQDLRQRLCQAARWAASHFFEVRLAFRKAAIADCLATRSRFSAGVDAELACLDCVDLDGMPRAMILSLPCHPVCLHGQPLISADLPGRVRDLLRAAYGKDLVVLCLLGACGDVNPAGFSVGGLSTEAAVELAETLAHRLPARLKAASPQALQATLSWAETACELPLQPAWSEAAVAERLQALQGVAVQDAWQAAALRSEQQWLQEHAAAALPPRPVQLQHFDLGGLQLVALSCELNACYAAPLRAQLRTPAMLATLCNGYAGYVTPPAAIDAATYEASQVPMLLGSRAYQRDAAEILLTATAAFFSSLPMARSTAPTS